VTGRPTLIVVGGPPGAGKTTLAHTIARAVGCPAICRDEIKEGMVHATPGFVAAPGDELTVRTLPTFFGVLGLLLRAGVTTVAEAAFQDHVWLPGLEPLRGLAHVRVVQCVVDADVAWARVQRRHGDDPLRRAHGEPRPDHRERYVRLSLESPTLDVDTTDGYRPAIDEIVRFAART
jgi:predicted kinase